jgi:hypothetical protein
VASKQVWTLGRRKNLVLQGIEPGSSNPYPITVPTEISKVGGTYSNTSFSQVKDLNVVIFKCYSDNSYKIRLGRNFFREVQKIERNKQKSKSRWWMTWEGALTSRFRSQIRV